MVGGMSGGGVQGRTTPVRPPGRGEGGDPDANLEAPGGGHRRGSKEHPTCLETPMGSADAFAMMLKLVSGKHQVLRFDDFSTARVA